MCIILIGNVTKEVYEAAKRANPDGYSVFTKDLGVIKAPSKEQTTKGLNTFGIWHFRIRTSGKTTEFNIHPFPICHGKYVLYHNGIVCSPHGDKSDTHLLGDFLQNVDLETAKTVLNSIVKAKYNNRFVIANVNDPTEYYVFGDWVFDDGVLMSHPLYIATAPSILSPYYSSGKSTTSKKPDYKTTPKPSAPTSSPKVVTDFRSFWNSTKNDDDYSDYDD